MMIVEKGTQYTYFCKPTKESISGPLWVNETVTVRWKHFVGEGQGWYSWGFVRESQSSNFLDSITGNTAPSGSFEWQVASKLCGHHIQLEMCSGSPPRRTKHSCHRSGSIEVLGQCQREAPKSTTSTTTAYLRELGPLDVSIRSRRFRSASAMIETSATAATVVKPTLVLVVVWLGPLPAYVPVFVETAEQSGVHFLVFHTQNDAPKVAGTKVRFRHMSLNELAERMWKIGELRNFFQLSFEDFTLRVKECYASDNPAKGNDLKPIYGALFQQELAGFSHWGWTDLDMIWGNLSGFLDPLLPVYDVISAPDGQRPALYLSGQLTIFRNQDTWRNLLSGCLEGPGHVNYGGCYLESLLSEANCFLDEKVAIWYVALRKAHVFFDFSLLLTEPRWLRLGQRLHWRPGRLAVQHRGGLALPFADLEQRNAELHSLKQENSCFSEFGLAWSFVCIPFEPRSKSDTYGVAYELQDHRLYLWPSPLAAAENGTQFAAFHLHRAKAFFQAETWTAGCRQVCVRSRVLACACERNEMNEMKEMKDMKRIPKVVHFVLTDRDTRFFDWPCYVAIRSAWEHLRPDELLVHLLDGVEPQLEASWWRAARRYITRLVPFERSAVPMALNGARLRHPAFIADFQRIQVLYDSGGIYMDTDALSLRDFDTLRSWRGVLARQGGELRATVGLMMFEKGLPFLKQLLERMKSAYTGAWGVHAGHVLDDMLREAQPEGIAILAHSSGFFASSWHASDFVELMEERRLDWSRCWSLHLYNSQTKPFGPKKRPAKASKGLFVPLREVSSKEVHERSTGALPEP